MRSTCSSLARRALHVRGVAIYFAILLVWRLAVLIGAGTTLPDALLGGLWIVGLGGVAIAVLCVLAWLLARSTLYTVTNRRLVMRFGVALPGATNLPVAALKGRLSEPAGRP